MGDEVLNLVPSSEAEADSLIAAIEAPTSEETPTQSAPESSAPPEIAPPPQKDPFDFEDEINWRGENRKLHYSKIKQFAQQGYDYSEKMREFNSTRHLFENEKTTWQKEREAFQKDIDAYKTVDEFAKQNPSWWQHVQSQFQEVGKDQAAQASPQIPPQLAKKLERLESFVETAQAKEEAQKRAQEDATLDSDIQVFRQSHPDLDWTSTKEFETPKGVVRRSLDQQICQYMVDHKIGSFRAAARDFLWDDIQKKTELKAKEQVGKEIQKATKYGAGVLNPSQKPTPRVSINPSQYSYDELVAQALHEIGAA